jgi:hypothetical protein
MPQCLLSTQSGHRARKMELAGAGSFWLFALEVERLASLHEPFNCLHYRDIRIRFAEIEEASIPTIRQAG